MQEKDESFKMVLLNKELTKNGIKVPIKYNEGFVNEK
jgi:hypothetical protein